MTDKPKRPPGRPKKYDGTGEGAPFLGLRLEPPIYEHIKARAEGPRAFIERLVSESIDQDREREQLRQWLDFVMTGDVSRLLIAPLSGLVLSGHEILSLKMTETYGGLLEGSRVDASRDYLKRRHDWAESGKGRQVIEPEPPFEVLPAFEFEAHLRVRSTKPEKDYCDLTIVFWKDGVDGGTSLNDIVRPVLPRLDWKRGHHWDVRDY
jgi:hypothetical protein